MCSGCSRPSYMTPRDYGMRLQFVLAMSRCLFSNSALPQEEMNEIAYYAQPASMQISVSNTKHNFNAHTFAKNIDYYSCLHSTYKAIEDTSKSKYLKYKHNNS